MKKFLSAFSIIFIALILPTGTLAQLNAPKGDFGRLTRSNVVKGKTVMKAPQHARLTAGQVLLGSYTTDDYVTNHNEASGLPNYPGTLKIANDISASELAAYQGTQIVAMRAAFVIAPGAVSLFITPYDKEGKILASVFEQKIKSATAGWNNVRLDTPYTIDTEKIGGLILGFSYKQLDTNNGQYYYDECYPLSILSEGNNYPLLVSGINGTSTWYSMGNGNLSVQAIVEGEFAQNAAKPLDFGTVLVPFGGTVDHAVSVRNLGKAGISSISYVISVDGQAGQEQTVSLPSTFNTFNGVTDVDITFPSSDTECTEERTITITKVNGQPNEADQKSASGIVSSTSKSVVKRVVVEEYTGTDCGWCPRGLVGMENMHQQFGDKFVGIGLHQYNSSDAMYLAATKYAPVEFSGAPSSQVDRLGEADPYYDAPAAVEYMLSVPAKVGVELVGLWNAEQTKVEATATVMSLIDGASYSIEYVLVADGLKGTGSGWKQSNYYASYSASELPEDLACFGKGGTYGSSSFSGWEFNDVAIASSYTNKVNKAKPLKDMKQGEAVTNTFTLSLPTGNSLAKAIQKDKVSVAALIVDADGSIANAIRVPVTSTNGIRATLNGSPVESATARYSLDGRQISESRKGLNIVRMADGTVRKVFEK